MVSQESAFPAELDEIYQEVILDHYRNPRNKGKLPQADLSSRGFNPFCGDEVVLEMKLSPEGRVETSRFTGQGCSISQASASMLTQLVKRKSLDQAHELSELFRSVMQGHALTGEEAEQVGELEALQGVRKFPIRIKCALLAWATLDDAIKEYKAKR
ncbi:MAG: SUF system NifU family Fe-S cluster assembly protein [SAR202 cluster bacterium]|nr:SUF system NifU family Fe-S cluster assembly protein [SAR202 cluster bacterium]